MNSLFISTVWIRWIHYSDSQVVLDLLITKFWWYNKLVLSMIIIIVVSAIHEKCFMTFMLTSELYMVMTCILLSRFRAQPPNNVESKSLRLKYQLLAINMVSFALAGYFFIRHNLYCEPGGKFLCQKVKNGMHMNTTYVQNKTVNWAW